MGIEKEDIYPMIGGRGTTDWEECAILVGSLPMDVLEK